MTERPGTSRVIVVALSLLLPAVALLTVVLVVAGGSDDTRPSARGVVHAFEVPAGTAEAQSQGLAVGNVFPENYAVQVGDTVTVLNNDDTVHTFGPFTVRPGERQSLTFDRPGRFSGACTVGPHETVTITVG